MTNLAQKIRYDQPCLEYGTVVEDTPGALAVSVNGLACAARAAVGCLVRPERGDTVLVTLDAAGCCYVLAVLERPGGDGAPKTLAFQGQVNIDVREGGLAISAGERITLASPDALALTSGRLDIQAREGEAQIENFRFLGHTLASQIQKVRLVADAVDSIVRRVVQRLTSSYRYVEEHEEIQSASTRMLVDGTLTMQTKNTMHTAEGHVKIDAAQIHLG